VVQFSASNGVQLSGWLVIASPNAPTIILVHGFNATRVSVLPWARFLYAAHFNVLLYESWARARVGGLGQAPASRTTSSA
jgi:dipeptidyl aminopeptidase/acylaminoacyl peptidase